MSINSALTMAVNSLQVNQLALSVVQNNIANMNTEGYSKHRVNLGTRFIGGKESTNAYSQVSQNAGVQINSITRYANEFLSEYYRKENGDLGYYTTEAELANHVITLLDEMSNGGSSSLSVSLDEFYSAAATLQQTPTDITARTDFVEKANKFTLILNSKYKDLTAYRESLVGDGTESSMNASKLADNVNKANALLNDLADINKRIISSGTINSAANNLYDQRDSILSELSGYLNINTSISENGVASVSLNGLDLVRHTTVMGSLTMKANYQTAADIRVTIGLKDNEGKQIQTDINDKITGGSIGAILQMGGPSDTELTVQNAIDMLDNLAIGIAEVMNGIQTQGWIEQNDGTYIPDPNATSFAMSLGKDADGNIILASPTEKLFVARDGGSVINAGNLSVNNTLRNNRYGISAAIVSGSASDLTNTVEIDGEVGKRYTFVDESERQLVGNGKAMGEDLNTRISTTSSHLDGLSPETFVMSGVSKIGTQTESILNQQESQDAKCSAVKSQLLNETGVDLNEELMDMVKYQQAYQASARVFNACCDIMNVLLSLGA